MVISYVFGTRDYVYEGYGSDGGSPGTPFVFTVSTVKGVPSSWPSAYALLGFFRRQFIAACRAAGVSSRISPIDESLMIIPTCYLDRPTIEVDGVELLLDGEKPNPWLSLAKK